MGILKSPSAFFLVFDHLETRPILSKKKNHLCVKFLTIFRIVFLAGSSGDWFSINRGNWSILGLG